MRNEAIREGHEIFTSELTRLAERAGDWRLTGLVDELRGPLRIAVRGRDGVGRGTVSAALAADGLLVAVDGEPADVSVVVVAEALKPEDRALLGLDNSRSSRPRHDPRSSGPRYPSLLVLNKADLAGFGAGGPIAVADRRAAALQAMTGVPTVAMVGLLAAATVDEELLAALRVLATQPADLTSVDGFLGADHSVSRDLRARLISTLDLFGIAHCVLALRQDGDPSALPGMLRRLSQVERVTARLAAVGAEARYRRMRATLTTLRTMAAGGAPAVAEFLSGDDAVLAMMAVAVDVVQAAGLTVDTGDDPSAHLERAVHWHRYGRGPVNRLHGHCAADICRGSLRLLQRTEPR